jgi:serine/threonine protein kinase
MFKAVPKPTAPVKSATSLFKSSSTPQVQNQDNTMLQQQFQLQRSIGRALYGDVWLARDMLHPDQIVAIKQVSLRNARRALAANKHMDNPFDERRMACHLMSLPQHDNILTYHQEFLERGSWYIVMEHCEGGDLLTRLQAAPQNQLTEATALFYFRQVAQGVHFLHTSGIAHRDISLENVLLKNNVCKICDFGLSTEANRVCKERVGKAYYMAPEVVAEQAYDPMAADLWPLGILLFILITGSPLVPIASREENAFLAFEAAGVEKVLGAWGMSANVSPALMHLLSGLLHVDPAKRLSISDVLAHCKSNLPSTSRSAMFLRSNYCMS